MISSRELAAALEDALRDEPPGVPIKALVAAAVMCARGGAPTRAGMARVGGYSYGSSQTHYAGLLTALIDRIPELVTEMAFDDIDPAQASRLRKDLQQRDNTIGALRIELAQLTERHAQVRNYALALHAEVDAGLDPNSSGVSSMARVLQMHPAPRANAADPSKP